MTNLRAHFFQDDEYVEEFTEFLETVTWSDRSPLNTEMLYLWSMIRAVRPQLFIESGTFKGYSANFICEALKRNDNGPEFVTFGFDLDNCLTHAGARLEKYSFASVVEGDSRNYLRSWEKEPRPTAFFIDGPKGHNMPPLFFAILGNFANIGFIAVHDCQKESGSRNRLYLSEFFSEYPIMFCESEFESRYSHLDEPLIGKSELVNWRPFEWDGTKQDSYGTETGYALPILGKTGTSVSRLRSRFYRQIRFRLYPNLSAMVPSDVKAGLRRIRR